ncbi:MAG: tripartite tricarboxylate transporter TctB family protein [Clostridia bacterium]
MKSLKLTGEKLVNLFLLCISAFYLFYSLSNYRLGSVANPKAGFMPMLIGAAATLVSAILTTQAFMGKGDAKNVKLEIDWKRFAGIVAASLLYAASLNWIGYLIGTFLFLLVILKLAKVKGWIQPLLIAVITAVAFYLVFKVALGVKLPTGFLPW